MIKLYVYQVTDGRFIYESFGLAEYVVHDISPDYDFTLTPPPMNGGIYRWIGDKWVKDID